VPSYLVETYLARDGGDDCNARWQRAAAAADELTREGTRVRFDHTIFVPEDEICFFVVDAPSSRDVVRAAERARLQPFRVVEAISSVRDSPGRSSKDVGTDAIATLTPRERDVIHCVADGLRNREIAATLVVEPSTVRKHLENIYEKLGVGNRTAALAKLRDFTPRGAAARVH
jgi:DNA-binding CsgD family transcriptional regulator